MKRSTLDTLAISLGGMAVFTLFWITGFNHDPYQHTQAETEHSQTITKTASSGVGAAVADVSAAKPCVSGKGVAIRIELSDTAYIPATMSAKRCDILTIVNVGKKSHQPVSGPRPTYSSYPELNTPLELQAGEMFTAQFSKSGEYSLYDHLNDAVEVKLSITDE